MMLPYVFLATCFPGSYSPLFSTDYVLTQDKSFKKFAKSYADSQDLFFKE